MVYVFLADGFEEIEAIETIDILRRGGLEVATVGVTGKRVAAAHGICVEADILPDEVRPEQADCVILPGGMPGTTNLKHSKQVQTILAYAVQNEKLVCAICAAPSVLTPYLQGKKATCYPGFEAQMKGVEVTGESVVQDGNFITAKGAGVAAAFGFAILARLKDEQTAKTVRAQMQYAE